ncbi:hypothetical protein CBR_g34783 [Chara braunii]|uniref:Uncharacterized protein n=1 Tax=Chara braunii TaxID=69332 RepID=A0A388LJG1_CHABU|nr:hypothetical protein CBR_g34783 [Chara braunii]|eukprot:GBG82407.1 hypothetical protein CBR_g34783 [Chara braunii]
MKEFVDLERVKKEEKVRKQEEKKEAKRRAKVERLKVEAAKEAKLKKAEKKTMKARADEEKYARMCKDMRLEMKNEMCEFNDELRAGFLKIVAEERKFMKGKGTDEEQNYLSIEEVLAVKDDLDGLVLTPLDRNPDENQRSLSKNENFKSLWSTEILEFQTGQSFKSWGCKRQKSAIVSSYLHRIDQNTTVRLEIQLRVLTVKKEMRLKGFSGSFVDRILKRFAWRRGDVWERTYEFVKGIGN